MNPLLKNWIVRNKMYLVYKCKSYKYNEKNMSKL